MKNFSFLFFLIIMNVLKTSSQESAKADAYKVPATYHFDYKVIYEINNEEHKTPEKVSYYFTSNGDYMSMETADSQKDSEMNFMIRSKEGLMITFGEESVPDNPDKNRKVLKVMDMRNMLKGAGEGMAELAKDMPKKANSDVENKKPNELDNFVKTGKTKQVFGYTAEEYSKQFTKVEDGKTRSGTMSVWYAKVDFDPQMMFSMGLGNLAGEEPNSKRQVSRSNNMIGLGLTQKNYLLVEMDFAEQDGKSGTGMKVVSIEKTDFGKSTEGYFIKNYSGLSMKEMMMKEMEGK